MTHLVNGAAYFANQQQVAVVDEAAYTVPSQSNVRFVDASVACTVFFPAEPRAVETLRFLATGGAITLNGNGHPVAGGVTNVAQDTFLEFSFSPSAHEWVPGATGTIVPNGPAPPNRSLQFDDAGVFGGATFLFEADNSVRATLDDSALTQVDQTTGNLLYVYQHAFVPNGDPGLPPGTVLNYGTDFFGDPTSQPDTVFFSAGKIMDIYVGFGDGTAGKAWLPGAKFNGVSPALTTYGWSFRKNLSIVGTDVNPGDDWFGGGDGVLFLARYQVKPTVPPTSAAGADLYVDQVNDLPYWWNSNSKRFAAFEQPTFPTFGAEEIPNPQDGRSFLFPGFQSVIAAAAATPWPLPPSAVNDKMVIESVSVAVRVAGTGAGTVTYTVIVDGVDTALTATHAVSSGAVVSALGSVTVAAGSTIAIGADFAGVITDSPLGIVCTLAIAPNPNP